MSKPKAMPRARLAVTLPESSPLGRVTRARPDAHLSVHTAVPNVDTGGAAVDAALRAPSLPAVVAALAEADGVTLDVLARDAERVRCHVQLAEAAAMRAAASAGAPPAFPFAVADGTLRWEITAPGSALSALADALDAAGVEFDVTSVSSSVEASRLTVRQQHVLEAAVRRGYFETPRGCSLDDVAAEVGVAKSTCSETLRRAQQAVLSRYLDAGPVPGETA